MERIPKPGRRCRPIAFINIRRRCERFHRAIGALEFQQQRERARKFLPKNAGKAWSHQEDAQICDEIRRGFSFEKIAQMHDRTNGSIIARLVRLGKISAGQPRKTA